jgi:hypothetical protein
MRLFGPVGCANSIALQIGQIALPDRVFAPYAPYAAASLASSCQVVRAGAASGTAPSCCIIEGVSQASHASRVKGVKTPVQHGTRVLAPFKRPSSRRRS